MILWVSSVGLRGFKIPIFFHIEYSQIVVKYTQILRMNSIILTHDNYHIHLA